MTKNSVILPPTERKFLWNKLGVGLVREGARAIESEKKNTSEQRGMGLLTYLSLQGATMRMPVREKIKHVVRGRTGVYRAGAQGATCPGSEATPQYLALRS